MYFKSHYYYYIINADCGRCTKTLATQGWLAHNNHLRADFNMKICLLPFSLHYGNTSGFPPNRHAKIDKKYVGMAIKQYRCTCNTTNFRDMKGTYDYMGCVMRKSGLCIYEKQRLRSAMRRRRTGFLTMQLIYRQFIFDSEKSFYMHHI